MSAHSEIVRKQSTSIFEVQTFSRCYHLQKNIHLGIETVD